MELAERAREAGNSMQNDLEAQPEPLSQRQSPAPCNNPGRFHLPPEPGSMLHKRKGTKRRLPLPLERDTRAAFRYLHLSRDDSQPLKLRGKERSGRSPNQWKPF